MGDLAARPADNVGVAGPFVGSSPSYFGSMGIPPLGLPKFGSMIESGFDCNIHLHRSMSSLTLAVAPGSHHQEGHPRSVPSPICGPWDPDCCHMVPAELQAAGDVFDAIDGISLEDFELLDQQFFPSLQAVQAAHHDNSQLAGDDVMQPDPRCSPWHSSLNSASACGWSAASPQRDSCTSNLLGSSHGHSSSLLTVSTDPAWLGHAIPAGSIPSQVQAAAACLPGPASGNGHGGAATAGGCDVPQQITATSFQRNSLPHAAHNSSLHASSGSLGISNSNSCSRALTTSAAVHCATQQAPHCANMMAATTDGAAFAAQPPPPPASQHLPPHACNLHSHREAPSDGFASMSGRHATNMSVSHAPATVAAADHGSSMSDGSTTGFQAAIFAIQQLTMGALVGSGSMPSSPAAYYQHASIPKPFQCAADAYVPGNNADAVTETVTTAGAAPGTAAENSSDRPCCRTAPTGFLGVSVSVSDSRDAAVMQTIHWQQQAASAAAAEAPAAMAAPFAAYTTNSTGKDATGTPSSCPQGERRPAAKHRSHQVSSPSLRSSALKLILKVKGSPQRPATAGRGRSSEAARAVPSEEGTSSGYDAGSSNSASAGCDAIMDSEQMSTGITRGAGKPAAAAIKARSSRDSKSNKATKKTSPASASASELPTAGSGAMRLGMQRAASSNAIAIPSPAKTTAAAAGGGGSGAASGAAAADSAAAADDIDYINMRRQQLVAAARAAQLAQSSAMAAAASGRALRPRATASKASESLQAQLNRNIPTFQHMVQYGVVPTGLATFMVGNIDGVEAVVREDGCIELGGVTHPSISAFALAVLQARNPERRACDGWREVRYGGRRLADLRLTALERMIEAGHL